MTACCLLRGQPGIMQFEHLAQPPDLHARIAVALRIEAVVAAQTVDRNLIGLEPLPVARKCLFDKIFEQTPQHG